MGHSAGARFAESRSEMRVCCGQAMSTTSAARERAAQDAAIEASTSSQQSAGAAGTPTQLLTLQQSIGNRAVARLVKARRIDAVVGPRSTRGDAENTRVLARSSVHSDAELFQKMQAFRSKNSHLTTEQQNKIFWAVKQATDSDETAYAFFDYYSGSWGAGYKILVADGDDAVRMRNLTRLAETKGSSDTYVFPEVFSLPNATLGPLLLHEFAHTGGPSSAGFVDTEEGYSYGIEYFYAEHTGDKARVATIERAMTTGAGIVVARFVAALQLNFQVTVAVMNALHDLSTKGSSSFPPLAGKTADDGKLLTAGFVKSFIKPPSDVQVLITYVKANMSTFKFPAL